MPYFIYNIYPNRRLEPVERFDKYPDAKKAARTMRAKLTPDDEHTVKIVFAPNPEEAERLLLEKREPQPEGE